MSDVSQTAPSMNKQLVRGGVLVAVLVGCISQTPTDAADTGYRHALAMVHLLFFASWFGCSMWVSFIAGIIMFQNLPRHVFGRLQAKLFPAYFLFSAVMIAASIVSAQAMGWEWGGSLGIILATIMINLVYLEPKTTAVMYERHVIERKLGTGHEVGQLKPKDPQKANDPDLKRLSKKFGMLHGFSTLMNLGALGVGCYWLSFCAKQMVP